MNKSVIVYQLQLPKEIANTICRFIYYTMEETIARNKKWYNKVICDLFYTVRLERDRTYYNWNYSYNQNYITLFIYNIQSKFDIQCYICCKCGNYTKPHLKCKCN